MSNLLKSKIFLGVMVFAAVVAMGSTQAAASTAITHTLKAGSSYTAEVKTLQADLGITADGKFGPATKAAVMAFQTKNGLTADGVVGPKTAAALSSGSMTTTTTTTTTTTSTYPAGCNSNTGFSSTTGMSCAVATTFPAGCTSAVGFSPTTGMSCGTVAPVTTFPAGCTSAVGFSSTTGASCSTGVASTVSSTGEGTLTLQSAPVSVTTNPSQGDSKDTVLAFGLKATGSNVTVNRVNVDLASTNSLPWSYFSTLYLYNGSTLLATLPVNSNTLTQNTFGTNYTASFQGLSSVVPVDTTSSFIVEADIATTIPATTNGGLDHTYVFGLNDQSTSQVIRGTDGAGLSEYVGNTANYNQTLTLGTSGNGTLSVVTDNSNPIGNNVVEQSNQTATGVTALVFDLKNTSNNPATIESITVQPTSAYTSSVSAWYLYNGGSSIQSLGNQGCTVTTCVNNSSPSKAVVFDNFTPFTVAPNSSTVMSVKFDAATLATGAVQVSLTGSTGVSALLNNTLTSVTGSATGNNFVLIGTNGVSVNLVGNPVFTTYPATVAGTTGYTSGVFTFSVSPVGVSLADLSKAGAVVLTGSVTTTGAGGTTPITTGIVSPVLTNGISDGNTATITVTVNRPDTGAGTLTYTITGLQLATNSWVSGALNSGNSVTVNAGLSNATVQGYTNQ